jgi:hypothetical protein
MIKDDGWDNVITAWVITVVITVTVFVIVRVLLA